MSVPQRAQSAEDLKRIAAVARGDQTALAALYESYAARMLGLACRLLGNRQDAEDLVHDVFVEVWHKAGRFDSRRGSLRGWLLLRVRSRALDRLRSLEVARRHGMAAQGDELYVASADPGPEREAEQARLHGALQRLTPLQRQTLELCYFQDLTHKEIAHRQAIPVGTAKSRLGAAVARLREDLAPAAAHPAMA